MIGVSGRQPGARASVLDGNGVRVRFPSHVNVEDRVGRIVGVHRFLLVPCVAARGPHGSPSDRDDRSVRGLLIRRRSGSRTCFSEPSRCLLIPAWDPAGPGIPPEPGWGRTGARRAAAPRIRTVPPSSREERCRARRLVSRFSAHGPWYRECRLWIGIGLVGEESADSRGSAGKRGLCEGDLFCRQPGCDTHRPQDRRNFARGKSDLHRVLRNAESSGMPRSSTQRLARP